MGSPKPFPLFCGLVQERRKSGKDQLSWVYSNNYAFLWVTHKQNAFVWVTLKPKHLFVGNYVTFKFFCG